MKQPNILVFMTDQQNADTVFGGNCRAVTPNLDDFRRRGLSFIQTFCPSPHCCPSRASFFSGLYPSQHGVWNNVEGDNALSRGLYDGVTLFPELLKKAGYRTLFSGKWHVSAWEGPGQRGFTEVLHEVISNYGRSPRENRPQTRAWDRFYRQSCPHHPGAGVLRREGYPDHRQYFTQEDPFGDRITVEKACRALEAQDGNEPFFLYVGVTGPHDPYTPPEEYLRLYDDIALSLPESFRDTMDDKPALYRRTRDRYALTEEESLASLKHYLAFASWEDALFGKLLDALDRSGQRENTYVFYLSDHGDYAGAHGLWAKGLPCFREGYHIPLIAAGPGIPAGESVSVPVSLLDLCPTILELAGMGAPETALGQSLAPFLRGQQPPSWRQALFTQTNGNELYGIQRSVRTEKWKYVFNGFDYDELYDLEHDPGELRNLASLPESGPVIRQLCRLLWENAEKAGDSCTSPYIMVSLAPQGPGILHEDM